MKLTAKNELFAGHDEGAAGWARIVSLIETCKMNGVEPYAWLKSTLEKIAAGHPQSRPMRPRSGGRMIRAFGIAILPRSATMAVWPGRWQRDTTSAAG